MTIDEKINRLRETVNRLRRHAPKDEDFGVEARACKRTAEGFEQEADWLEELKELREYKARMERQYLDDIGNPLEPLKLQSALESEIFKYTYRKEHKPRSINILDYTIMAALKDCLERQVKK